MRRKYSADLARSAPNSLAWVAATVLPAAGLLWASPTPANSVAGPVALPLESASGATVSVTWTDLVRLVDGDPQQDSRNQLRELRDSPRQLPQLVATKLAVDASRAGVDAARAVPNPSLEASVGQGLARFGGGSRLEWGLALNIPLGWITQRNARLAAAQAEVEVAQAESLALRRDILLQLQVLFWTLAFDQARVASLAALEAQTAELVQMAQKLVANGEVRPVEATRVEVELEKATGELEAARISRDARQAQLALWLGVPKGQAVVAMADLSTLPPVVSLQSALARLGSTHPTLAAARARVRALEANVDTERMARVPPLSLQAFTADELDRRFFGMGLSVDLPLWNWNGGRISAAESSLGAGRKLAEAAALELEATVIELQAACAASVQTATRLGNAVVPRSEMAASTIEKTYRIGEASVLEVIDARRTLTESRRLYLSALVQARIDCSRFDALVGDDP